LCPSLALETRGRIREDSLFKVDELVHENVLSPLGLTRVDLLSGWY